MHEVILARGNTAQQGVLCEGLDGEADLFVGTLADEDGDGAVPEGVHVRFQIIESHHAALRIRMGGEPRDQKMDAGVEHHDVPHLRMFRKIPVQGTVDAFRVVRVHEHVVDLAVAFSSI